MPPMPWLERRWRFDLPAGAFPMVVERLRGTPARCAELVRGVADATLTVHPGGRWSVKQHLGHLADLNELDDRRLREFRARAAQLTPADMGNARTEQGGHDAAPVERILDALRRGREALTAELDQLAEADVVAQALHPRLGRPMRLIDWAWFVAEHDDHHLAWARHTLRAG